MSEEDSSVRVQDLGFMVEMSEEDQLSKELGFAYCEFDTSCVDLSMRVQAQVQALGCVL